jgi:hypothetical protein
MDQSIRAGRWIGKLANAQVGAPIVFLYPTGPAHVRLPATGLASGDYSIGSSTNTGIWRSVFVWYVA